MPFLDPNKIFMQQESMERSRRLLQERINIDAQRMKEKKQQVFYSFPLSFQLLFSVLDFCAVFWISISHLFLGSFYVFQWLIIIIISFFLCLFLLLGIQLEALLPVIELSIFVNNYDKILVPFILML